MTSSGKKTIMAVFVCIFGMELAAGYYLAHIYGFMPGDALSRVANAFYVLYSRFPALANIGFVWNPLPSLLDLPLLLLYPAYPAVASSGLAGVFWTGLFAALTAAVLVHAGMRFGMGRAVSVLFALAYACNPYIFYYGANGLTEAIFIFFIAAAVVNLLVWEKAGGMIPLAVMAFSLSLAFWTRYEAVPLGIALAAAVCILSAGRTEGAVTLDQKRLRVEGQLVILLTPVVFSGLLWIFFNYTIMGDALYFLRSSYSNLGQAELTKGSDKFAAMINHPGLVLPFVAERVSRFSIPLGVIIAIRIVERRLWRRDTAILLALAFSIPAMQFALLLKGASAAWIRYYMYPLPIAAAWIPYEWSLMQFRKTGGALLLGGFAASAVLLALAMNNPAVASDEYEAFHRSKLYAEQQAKRETAVFIREHTPDDTHILTDSFSSFGVIMSSERPKRFIMTSDRDFNKALLTPIESHAEFILVPNPVAVLSLDKLNQLYPDLYEKGAPWCTLYREFGGYWRLYRVIADPG